VIRVVSGGEHLAYCPRRVCAEHRERQHHDSVTQDREDEYESREAIAHVDHPECDGEKHQFDYRGA